MGILNYLNCDTAQDLGVGSNFTVRFSFSVAEFLIKRVMELILFLVDLNISDPGVCKNIKDSCKGESDTPLYNGITGLL